MFNFFRAQREKKAIHEAFKELAAISGYIVINTIEQNTDVLSRESQPVKLLDDALAFSEENNYRVAYIHFMQALGELDKLGLIDEREDDVAQGLTRIRELKTNVIDKLFRKYY